MPESQKNRFQPPADSPIPQQASQKQAAQIPQSEIAPAQAEAQLQPHKKHGGHENSVGDPLPPGPEGTQKAIQEPQPSSGQEAHPSRRLSQLPPPGS